MKPFMNTQQKHDAKLHAKKARQLKKKVDACLASTINDPKVSANRYNLKLVLRNEGTEYEVKRAKWYLTNNIIAAAIRNGTIKSYDEDRYSIESDITKQL